MVMSSYQEGRRMSARGRFQEMRGREEDREREVVDTGRYGRGSRKKKKEEEKEEVGKENRREEREG